MLCSSPFVDGTSLGSLDLGHDESSILGEPVCLNVQMKILSYTTLGLETFVVCQLRETAESKHWILCVHYREIRERNSRRAKFTYRRKRVNIILIPYSRDQRHVTRDLRAHVGNFPIESSSFVPQKVALITSIRDERVATYVKGVNDDIW